MSAVNMSREESLKSNELIKVEELTPRSRRVNMIVTVASKSEVREVASSRDYSMHRVADALVGDETGSIYLTLWDDAIDKINEDDTIKIKNSYVNLFRGSMRLNTGRYGSFELLEGSPISKVNTENNLSDKQYEQEMRYPPSYRTSSGYKSGYKRRRY